MTDTAHFLSRFANPKRTKPVPLGPCRCPGQPHEAGDSATVRAEIGEGELKSAQAAGIVATNGEYYDAAVGDDSCLARFTSSWTLLQPVLDDSGEPVEGKVEAVPITLENAHLLDSDTRTAILVAIEQSILGRALPNASGAPSRASRRASESRTQTSRKRP